MSLIPTILRPSLIFPSFSVTMRINKLFMSCASGITVYRGISTRRNVDRPEIPKEQRQSVGDVMYWNVIEYFWNITRRLTNLPAVYSAFG